MATSITACETSRRPSSSRTSLRLGSTLKPGSASVRRTISRMKSRTTASSSSLEGKATPDAVLADVTAKVQRLTGLMQ